MNDTKAEINKGKIMLDMDIIWITTGLYEAFMAKGRQGLDAYVLYSHLVYTSRLQGTNSVWAVDNYLKNGLQWGKARVRSAKDTLVEMDLIDIDKSRAEDGTFNKSYTNNGVYSAAIADPAVS